MPLNPTTPAIDVRISTLEERAERAIDELRFALGEVLGHMPGSFRRAVELQRLLNLDKKLAWQVFRVLNSEGLAELQNVPARSSMRRLLEAARRRRAPKASLARAWAAFERLEDFTIEHGGDREGLISMLGGGTRAQAEQLDLKIRKALFRGNAHAWGVQAQLQVRTAIVLELAPGPPRRESTLMVFGQIGLQRVRANQPLAITSWVRTTPTAGGTSTHAPAETELLEDFCTHPLPRMESRAEANGMPETELFYPPRGRTGAFTLYTSQYIQDSGGLGREYAVNMLVAIPAERVVCDLLVPAGWSAPATARAAVYGRRHHPEQVYALRDIDLMGQHLEMRHLGEMEGIPPVAGAPRQVEAVQHVLAQRGGVGRRFDVYRGVAEYPVLHTLLRFCVDKAAAAL